MGNGNVGYGLEFPSADPPVRGGVFNMALRLLSFPFCLLLLVVIVLSLSRVTERPREISRICSGPSIERFIVTRENPQQPSPVSNHLVLTIVYGFILQNG